MVRNIHFIWLSFALMVNGHNVTIPQFLSPLPGLGSQTHLWSWAQVVYRIPIPYKQWELTCSYRIYY